MLGSSCRHSQCPRGAPKALLILRLCRTLDTRITLPPTRPQSTGTGQHRGISFKHSFDCSMRETRLVRAGCGCATGGR